MTVTTATGDKQSYSYDTLKRLGTVTTANASGTTLFYTARSYAAGAASNQTTDRISGFSYRKSSGDIINYNTYNDTTTDAVIAIGGVATGYLVYVGVKWIAATFLAPFTGGGSYALAFVTP